MEKLFSLERVKELMILISQIDKKEKENLLTIFIFLYRYESSDYFQSQDSYKKVMKTHYADLIVGVNKRDYKVDLNIFDFLDLNKFGHNFLAVELHIQLLDNFIKLTPYEQNNLLKIIKFICYSQKGNIHPSWNVSSKNFNLYNELVQEIKIL
ncbi:hypothetical protein NIES2107_74390 (plasmid) [Nostoc carneum NIES-2107]|nr:hypothetical protein NIES2107_74390 [Nostoc carneum NIES-2107]